MSKIRVIITLILLIGINSFCFAKPYPPINIRVLSASYYNRIYWKSHPSNPDGTVKAYQICRSTTPGAEVPIATRTISNPTNTSYAEHVSGYAYDKEFYYTVRAVGTDNTVSDDSEEVKRFLPRVGLTDIPISVQASRNRIYGNWDMYPGQWSAYTYGRIRPSPAGGPTSNNVGYYYRQVLRYSSQDAGTPETLSGNGPFYLEIIIYRPDTWGNPADNFWVSYCDSLPFYIDDNMPLEDIASATFNNSLKRVMAVPLSTGGVEASTFQNSGGGFWRMRKPVRISPHLKYYYYMPKLNAPCRATINIASGEIAAGHAAAEVRVADEFGHEIPSIVMGEQSSGGWVTSFNVHFIVASQQYRETQNYWVYWGNSSATQVAYNFKNHCDRTAQFDYTPWYSRRMFRISGLDYYKDTDSYRLVPATTSPADDNLVKATLPFNFPFFDIATNVVYVSTNGYISMKPYSNHKNTWSDFTSNSSNMFISPLWCNLMENSTAPSNSGLYYYKYYTSNEFYSQERFTWMANRYNATNELYQFQVSLFKKGDITFRYQNINQNALSKLPSGSDDNPLNATIHHTAGISASDGNRWLSITDGSGDTHKVPLKPGVGQNPGYHFQSCYSWIFDDTYSDPTNVCSMSGLTSVAHYDSRIMNGNSSSLLLGNVEYDISGNGGVDIYLRSSSTDVFGDWVASDKIATNAIGVGSISLNKFINQYIQYRLVFKKSAASDNPRVNKIKLNAGYITIDSVTGPENDENLSQGQTFLATATITNHYSNALDIEVASLTFSPATAIHSWTRITPLPTGIAQGASATIGYSVTIATNSGNLDALTYIDAYVEASDGIATLTSSSANSRGQYYIRKKATVIIDKVETPFEKVNKGQGGIPVALDIINGSVFVPMALQGASLTFTLGDYSWSAQIASNSPLPGLVGRYYDTNNDWYPPGEEIYEPEKHTRIDPNINFYWGTDSTPYEDLGIDGFAIRWSGQLIPKFSETYTIYLYMRDPWDGGKLWLNGKPLIIRNYGVYDGVYEKSATVDLTAGVPVDFFLEYYERTWYASVKVSWSSSSQPKEVIPASQFQHYPENQVSTFTVAVLPTSPSGLSIIDGTASATNDWVPSLITEANHSLSPDSWVIQSPASISVGVISNPEFVYRGQTNVPVDVEVINSGEADALVASVPLYFTLGSYTSVIPGDTMPVTIAGGNSKNVRVLVSLAEDTPIGTAWIDADAIGTDGNVGSTITASGAAQAGKWTILGEKILTYRDALHLYPADSFTRLPAVNVPVYALAENLAPLKEYAIRWYDTSNQEIVSSTTIGFSNENGELTSEWNVTPVASFGVYTVKITNYYNTYSPAQTSFRVVTSASITATIELPATVSIGQEFPVVMNITNHGSGDATGIVASSLTASGTGSANQSSGPVPPSLEIPGDSDASFTWTYTAVSTGSFSLDGWASGFDANSYKSIDTGSVTSSLCHIQSPASVSINILTATPTIVYRDQKNIEVDMCLENHGEANAWINPASLTLAPNFGSYYLASPSIQPAILPGNSIATFVFYVSINSNAHTGVATMSSSIVFSDANNPVASYTVVDKSYSWNINAATIVCSQYAAFNSRQYEFNRGQTVYAKASGLPANMNVFMRFYDSADPFPPTTPGVGVLSPLDTGSSGIVSHLYDIPGDTDKLNKWMIIVDDDLDNDPNTVGNILAVQYFDVMTAATFSLKLRFASQSCFVGDVVNAELQVTNIATTPTNVEHYLYHFNYQEMPGSVGSMTKLSMTFQDWLPLESGSSYSFKIPMRAELDSGNGSYSIKLPGYSWRHRERNNWQYVWYRYALVSNSIRIYRETVDIASDTWDFGTIIPGDTSNKLVSQLNNPGNHFLNKVDRTRANLRKSITEILPDSYMTISPDFPMTVATNSSVILNSTFFVPFNQPPGIYLATMTVYEDFNQSNSFDVGDLFDNVRLKVTVASAAKAIVTTDQIDLGVVEAGQNSASKTIEFVGIGNIDSTDLKFQPIPNITFTPSIIGSFSYNEYGTASVFVSVPATATSGIYVATATLFDDIATGTSDSFTIKWMVGSQSLKINPPKLNFGNGTPTEALPPLSFNILNTGELPLNNVKGVPGKFINIDNPANIATENIDLSNSNYIATGSSINATASVYVPGGSATGTYIATFSWFDDKNNNGIIDAGEPTTVGLASFTIKPYYTIYALDETSDFGPVTRNTVRTINVGFRNAGNMRFDNVRYVISDMTNDTDVFDKTHLSASPDPYTNVEAGDLKYISLSATVVATQPLGVFSSPMIIYADLNNNSTWDAGEPKCQTLLKIQVGDQSISIETPSQVNLSGKPAHKTSEVYVSVKNNGSLALTNIVIGGTNLVHSGGGDDIASDSYFFDPDNTYGVLLPNQTKTRAVGVDIPVAASAGTYSATIWVWEDANKDFVKQPGEKAASIPVELIVDSSKALRTVPDEINFGIVAHGDVIDASFLTQNIGNVALSEVRWQKNPLTSSGGSISTSHVLLYPDPIGSMDEPPSGIPVSCVSSVTIDIPTSAVDGVYEGIIRVYEDDYNTAANTFDSGHEAFASLTVKLQVTTPFIGVTPNPIVIPSSDPTGQSASATFSVSNTGLIAFKNLTFSCGNLTNGTDVIPSANVSVLIASYTELSPSDSANGEISVNVTPQTLSPGTYVGTLRFWDDRNGNGVKDAWEGFLDATIKLDVNEYPEMEIITKQVDVGKIPRGLISDEAYVQVRNTGNVGLSNFAWFKSQLNLATTSTPIPNIEIASITFTPQQSEPVLRGELATFAVTVGRINPSQTLGEYGDEDNNGIIGPLEGNIQILQADYDGNIVTDQINLRCEVIPGGPQGLIKGTVYQEIATSTFPVSPVSDNYIFSAFVCPGTGTARIGFLTTDEIGNQVTMSSIDIDSNGNVNVQPATITGGIVESVENPSTGFKWYRIYVLFPFSYDENIASKTYILLQNPAAEGSGNQVLFDGIMLEKAGKNHEKPTFYHRGSSIVSPNSSMDVSGQKSYYQW